MRRADEIRLRHMLDASRQAVEIANGRNRSDLENDPMLKFSEVKLVEIIGEAAANVTDEGRNEFPGIPWIDISGMRNRLVHAYFDINLDILWKTIQDDLPPLIHLLEDALKPR